MKRVRIYINETVLYTIKPSKSLWFTVTLTDKEYKFIKDTFRTFGKVQNLLHEKYMQTLKETFENDWE